MPRIIYGTVALRQLLHARPVAGGSTRTDGSRYRAKRAKWLVGDGAAALAKNVGRYRCLWAVGHDSGLIGAYCGSVTRLVSHDCGLKSDLFVGRANSVVGPLHVPWYATLSA
jgi:hypothetical protein